MSRTRGIEPRTEALDALLPQTQCGQCGYAGCRPYAEAMAAGTADINRCPPGGIDVIADLARLLGRTPTPLDTSCGETKAPAVAVIDESWCIGCTLCILACPVDAIAGAAKVMHTVIAADCTGCELCIPPCPVDCIQMVAVERPSDRLTRMARATQARKRYLARQKRSRAGITAAQQPRLTPEQGQRQETIDEGRKRSAIARALKRARERIGNNISKQ